MTPLNAHAAQDMSPLWTPDGRPVICASTRGEGNPNVYRQAADGTGVVERISTSLPAQFPTSMSPDGKSVAMFTTTLPPSLTLLTLETPRQADGQRFLMIKEAAADPKSKAPGRLVVVLNWLEELRARAVPGR